MKRTKICKFITFLFFPFYINAIEFRQSSYSKIVQKLDQIHYQYPTATAKFSLGFNDQNQLIEGITVGDLHAPNPTHHLVVGVHHGNEVHSAALAMAFIESHLTIQPSIIYHVIPVLNVSGYNVRQRYEKNSQGDLIDPNRDYPDVCDTHKANFELLSTKLLSDYVRSVPFVGAVTIHGYIGTITFPWGMYTDNSETQDHDQFVSWTQQAAQHNGYQFGTHQEVIYPAVGTFEDWIYAEHGVWSILVEMARGANIQNDAMAISSFFDQLPSVRSTQHHHLGNCTRYNEKMRFNARP